MGSRLTTEKVIQQFINKFGSRYGYDRVDYRGNHVKVIVDCRIHGAFLVTPAGHKQGNGCPECFNDSLKSSQEDIIQQFVNIWGNQYGYDNFIYGAWDVKSKVLCKKHDCHFMVSPSHHKHKTKPIGCPQCGEENRKITRLETLKEKYTTKSIIEEFKLVWGDEYIYDEFIYTRNKEKGIIKCREHGRFLMSPNAHKHNKRPAGCPECAGCSISREEVKWLDSFNIDMLVRQHKIYVSEQTYIKVDGFDPSTNTVYEYNGKYWHGHPDVFPDRNTIHPASKKSVDELYKQTLLREETLKSIGYNLVSVWK